jgi:D-sedoheptulose 7-phosphate isomerase
MLSEPLNASAYFRELSQLLLETQVTNRLDSECSELTIDEGVNKAVARILSVKASSGKVMLIGNGGSAAIVSHMQNDLCDSVGVRAIVFSEAAFLTAASNDRGYQTFYEQAVKLWGEEKDLLIAVSSSGRSENILRAAAAALDKGSQVVTLSGFLPDNPLRQLGHLNFYVPSQKYGFVESAHAALGHFLTDSAVTSLAKVKVC